ncbi:MAG: phenylalanine--tRNA ligase subunit alpha [Desulfitibacter sp. BRH_c19]|nr:MAG: phenylalanine--tRNA ligase subunit alpha [Desulfitibacter sp. BRH_c19]
MIDKLNIIRDQAYSEITDCQDMSNLEGIKIKFLGKKGELTSLLRGMGQLTSEERPKVGKIANEVRDSIQKLLDQKLEDLKVKETEAKLKQEQQDVTLPGYKIGVGRIHPISQVLNEIQDIFQGLGYSIAEGPEIESDYYNFEALNLPKDHPARDMQDSFYITSEVLLRTHTSPVQVRVMEKIAPKLPVRIIAPGKVFRRDDDATHSPMFHQVEGLLIDREVTLGDLKGTLLAFAKAMFGEGVEIRLRPSYFPFTEPSAEVDISCVMCHGSGCRVCSGTGWLEILGSGMVHPRVLEMSGYDPEEVRGFAFGMGVERIAMLKYGINDLRLFFDNDIRFLEQFK